VVGNNLKGLREAFQEVTPVLESFNDGQHLVVVNLIVVFCRKHRWGAEGDGVPETVWGLLEQSPSSSKAWGVNLDSSWSIWIPEGKDRQGDEGSSEGVKSLLLQGAPLPWGILLGEVVEGASSSSKILDETSVEFGKS
jgi:hypothetical protein